MTASIASVLMTGVRGRAPSFEVCVLKGVL